MVNLRQDFIVRKGAQVASNVVIGTYAGANAAPVGGMIVSGNVGIGTATVDANVSLHVSGSLGSNDYYMDDTANYPGYAPNLYLNLINSSKLDSRISFTRASTATYVGQDGYIKTAGYGVPRFDYDPSYSPARPRGLLMEESGTNLAQYSQTLDNAYWTTTGGATVPAVDTLSPDGTYNAYIFTEDASGPGVHSVVQRGGITTSPAGGTYYTLSFFAKASNVGNKRYASAVFSGTAYTVQLNATFDVGTSGATAGTCVSADAGVTTSISYYGNGWYRCSATAATSTTGNFTASFRISSLTGGGNYTGDSVSGMYAWGMQLEKNYYLTSYVPTTSASAARSGDVASMPAGSWFNQAAGTLACDFQFIGSGASATLTYPSPVSLVGSDVNLTVARIYIRTTDKIIAGSSYNNGSNFDINPGISATSAKAAFTYGGSGNVAVNGATIGPTAYSTYGEVAVQNLLLMGASRYQNPLSGWLRSVSYWPIRLTLTQLASMTRQ